MKSKYKNASFGCKLSDVTKQKLKIIVDKTGLNQTEFFEAMIEKEYRRLKKGKGSRAQYYFQLDLFSDQIIDQQATLFDEDINSTRIA